MMGTCWVVPELAAANLTEVWTVVGTVGGALFVIGGLFGFLDAHRHRLWSLIASAIVAGSLYGATTATPEREGTPGGAADEAPRIRLQLSPVDYLIPVGALFAGSFFGAYLLHRKVRATTQPQAEGEPEPD